MSLMFAANAAVGVAKLWRFDAGTGELAQVSDIAGAGVTDDSQDCTAFGALCVFTADDAGDRGLFAYDPATAELRRIADTWAGGSDDPSQLFAWDDLLMFAANLESGSRKLFVSDGEDWALAMDVHGDPLTSDAIEIAGATDDELFVAATRSGTEAIWVVERP